MKILDRFVQLRKAAEEQPLTKKQIENLPPQQQEFPTDPSKVYLKQAPKGYSEEIDQQLPDVQYLEKLDKKLANKTLQIKTLAETLRNYKDNNLKQLENEYKQKVAAFKSSVQYDEKLRDLDLLVKEVGNNLLQLLFETKDVVFGLFKLKNLFVLIDYTIEEQKANPTDSDRLKAIEKVLNEDFGETRTAEIMQKAEKISNEIAGVNVILEKRFNIFPISEEHRKQGQVASDIDSLLKNANDSIIDLLIELHNIDTTVVDAISDLKHYGYDDSNIVQLPQVQPQERAASHGRNQDCRTQHLAGS